LKVVGRMGSEFFHEFCQNWIRELFLDIFSTPPGSSGSIIAFSGFVKAKESEFRSSAESLEEAIETDLRPDMETYEARHSWAAARLGK